MYPPLAGNPVVTAGDPSAMIAVIVNGRTGPLTVNGKTFNGQMPTWKGQLTNADIASVATYVRSSWGNNASPVTEPEVAAAGTPVSIQVGAPSSRRTVRLVTVLTAMAGSARHWREIPTSISPIPP